MFIMNRIFRIRVGVMLGWLINERHICWVGVCHRGM